jgi:hypothetical protein
MYVHLWTDRSEEHEKVASVFYGIMIPMVNPLIYSLRNQNVIAALKHMGNSASSLRHDFSVNMVQQERAHKNFGHHRLN